jgi:hypothetical protein
MQRENLAETFCHALQWLRDLGWTWEQGGKFLGFPGSQKARSTHAARLLRERIGRGKGAKKQSGISAKHGTSV